MFTINPPFTVIIVPGRPTVGKILLSVGVLLADTFLMLSFKFNQRDQIRPVIIHEGRNH